MNISVGHSTRMGAKGTANQDSVGIGQDVPAALVGRRGGLFVVADGFGKENLGAVASAAAVRTVTKVFYTTKKSDAGAALVEACQQANAAALQAVRDQAVPGSTGTTLTAITVRGKSMHIAHVGDSRAYLVRDGVLRPLTQDHTRGAEMLRAGTARAEQIAEDPVRGQLSRALGVHSDLQAEAVDHRAETVAPGDTILLCTDGVTDLVRATELAPILAEKNPQAATNAIMSLVEQRGLRDDASIVVVHLGGGGVRASVLVPLLTALGMFGVIAAVALLYPRLASPPVSATPSLSVTPPPSAGPSVQTPSPGGVALVATSTRTVMEITPIAALRPTSEAQDAAAVVSRPTRPVSPQYQQPRITGPADGAEFRGPADQIRLAWESAGPLGPDDAYVVLTDYPHGQGTWTDYQQTRETAIVVPAYLYDLLEGDRRVQWRVAIWRNVQAAGNRLLGTPVSPESEVRSYVWQAMDAGPTSEPTPSYEG